ncbi:MAG: FMN-binding protein [Endomicrobiia bacterium]
MKKFFYVIIAVNISFCKELTFEKLISSYVFVSQRKYPYYIIIDEKNNIQQFFIESKDWTDKIYGYGGPINLQIYFSTDGKIKKINVLEHYETKEFAEKVFTEEFLSQYYLKNIHDKFVLGKDIKAISGATISCNAVNEIIYQCVKNVNEYIFKKQLIKSTLKLPKKEIINSLLFLVLFSGSVVGYILNINLRTTIMLISLIFLGFFYYGGLSFDHIRNLVFLNFPFFGNLFFWFFILLVLFSVVFFGRLYCGWLCPFGSLTEFLFRIKKFLEIKYKKSLGKEIEIELIEDNLIVKNLRKFEKYYRYGKYIIAFVILLFPTMIFLEPFQYTFVIYRSKIKEITYLIFILVMCIMFIRIWCRYLCPLGGSLALFSKISLFRLRIKNEICLRCEICKVVCPMNAIVERDNKLKIIHNECILCNICRKSCGPRAVAMHFLLKERKKLK